jgi:hypothetical protein
MRILALPALLLALPPFHSAIQPLTPAQRAQLGGQFWHVGCPVPLSGLRLLTVSYWDFEGNVNKGELVVNRRAAAPLAKVFRSSTDCAFRSVTCASSTPMGRAAANLPTVISAAASNAAALCLLRAEAGRATGRSTPSVSPST